MPLKPDPSTSTLILRTTTLESETRIDVQWSEDAAGPLARIRASDPNPKLPVPDQSARKVVALDVLEATLDEEAWITAIALALEPGGTVVVRVPLEGPSAWLDALNLYRYAQDITGLGKKLEETKLKGWHRHYRPAELTNLLARQGLSVIDEDREGNPLLEVSQFGALVWGGMVKGSTQIEASVRTWREEREDTRRLVRLGPLSTRLTLVARKQP